MMDEYLNQCDRYGNSVGEGQLVNTFEEVKMKRDSSIPDELNPKALCNRVN